MQTADEHDHEAPPGCELADEVDVDLADDSAPAPLEREYLGSYASIAGYLRAMLEPEVTPACAWILDLLDYPAVQRRATGGSSCSSGATSTGSAFARRWL